MPNINMRLPDEVHKQIKILSTLEDLSLKEFIIKALEESVNGKKK